MEWSVRAVIFLLGFILACVFVIVPVRITPKTKKTAIFLDYSTAPILIVLLLVASTCIPWVVVVRGILGKRAPAWAVDETSTSYLVPYTVVVLFMALAYVCTSAEYTKCFVYIANKFSKAALASKNPNILGLSLFTLLAAIFTLTTSNDIVVLTLTPIILEFSRKTDAHLLLPLLLAEFCSANSFSAGLLSGNPSNIILASVFRIDFITYLKYSLVPAIVSGCCVYGYSILLARKNERAPKPAQASNEIELISAPSHVNEKESKVESKVEMSEPKAVAPEKKEEVELSRNGVFALLILLFLFCLFLCSTAISNRWPSIEFWHISVFVLAVTLIKDCIFYRKNLGTIWTITKALPWKVPLFLLSMFILVEGASYYHFTTAIADVLSKHVVAPVVRWGDLPVALLFNLLTCLACIVFNNLPATIFITRIISETSMRQALGDKTMIATFSTAAGTNFGACILPHASLAGLMWSSMVMNPPLLKKVWMHGTVICLLLVVVCSAMLTLFSWIVLLVSLNQ